MENLPGEWLQDLNIIESVLIYTPHLHEVGESVLWFYYQRSLLICEKSVAGIGIFEYSK